MKFYKKILLFLICGGYFFVGTHITFWFLGEDLWLDIYKNIDEGIYDLELKQYEYELTWQWESDVSQVVWGILEREWLECDIDTIQDIESIVSGPNPVWIVQLKCNEGGEKIWSQTVAKVQWALSDITTTFSDRAENKAQKIYEISKIGLYSDGNEENSPFDLIVDLQKIDRVIFSEEIEYNGEEFSVDDEALYDFLNEDKWYLYEEDEEELWEDEDIPEDEEIPTEEVPEEEETEEREDDDLPDHEYACFPPDLSGLDPDALDDLGDVYPLDDRPRRGRPDIPVIEDDYTVYTDGEYSNGASWGWPFPGTGPYGWYSATNDAWNCDSFFCIVIEFSIRDQKLLWGWQTTSIESILTKAAEHLEKFANTSLVQAKQTTNNFELGLRIPNLGDMLRGFWIQVQTKPAPILNIEQTEDKKNAVEWDTYTWKNLLTEYYKNIWLDYERRNDLDIFRNKVYERKVLEESSGLPSNYPPAKLSELAKFQEALEKNSEIVSLSVDKKVLQDDLESFYNQFVELERFVWSIYDFSTSLSGIIQKMRKIPTGKS